MEHQESYSYPRKLYRSGPDAYAKIELFCRRPTDKRLDTFYRIKKPALEAADHEPIAGEPADTADYLNHYHLYVVRDEGPVPTGQGTVKTPRQMGSPLKDTPIFIRSET